MRTFVTHMPRFFCRATDSELALREAAGASAALLLPLPLPLLLLMLLLLLPLLLLLGQGSLRKSRGRLGELRVARTDGNVHGPSRLPHL